MKHFYDILLTTLRDIHGEFSVRYLGISPETPFAMVISTYFLAAYTFSDKEPEVEEIERVLSEVYKELNNCEVHDLDTLVPSFDQLAIQVDEWVRNQWIGCSCVKFMDPNRSQREASYKVAWIKPESPKLNFGMQQAAVKAALAFAIISSPDLETLTNNANKVLATMNLKLVDLQVC